MESIVQLTPEGWFGLVNGGSGRGPGGHSECRTQLKPRSDLCTQGRPAWLERGLGWAVSPLCQRNDALYPTSPQRLVFLENSGKGICGFQGTPASLL